MMSLFVPMCVFNQIGGNNYRLLYLISIFQIWSHSWKHMEIGGIHYLTFIRFLLQIWWFSTIYIGNIHRLLWSLVKAVFYSTSELEYLSKFVKIKNSCIFSKPREIIEKIFHGWFTKNPSSNQTPWCRIEVWRLSNKRHLWNKTTNYIFALQKRGFVISTSLYCVSQHSQQK